MSPLCTPAHPSYPYAPVATALESYTSCSQIEGSFARRIISSLLKLTALALCWMPCLLTISRSIDTRKA